MNVPQIQRQLAFETKRFNKAVNVYANNIKMLQGSMMTHMNKAKKAAQGMTATRKIKGPCKAKGYGIGGRGKCSKKR